MRLPAAPRRRTPLIVVASLDAPSADALAARLRADGAVVLVAHSAGGCLRMATSVGPDAIMLDPSLPRQLERLLGAHPVSAAAALCWLPGPAAAEPAGLLAGAHPVAV